MQTPESKVDIGEGRYLYCVANRGTEADLKNIGLERNRVYVLSYKDIGILVHNCQAKPYESKEKEIVKSWFLSHLYVIDVAAKKFGTVIPFAFDTIIKGTENDVREWLIKEYDRLKGNLERLRYRAEYDIQVFMDVNSINQKIESENEEIKSLKTSIEANPRGIAHMLQKKVEMVIRNELRKEVEECSKKIKEEIREYADEIKEQKIIKAENQKLEDKEQILNLSCLVHNNNVDALGKILEKINKTKCLSAKFSGPWPPFNFVK